MRIDELTFAEHVKYYLPTTEKILPDSKCHISYYYFCVNVYKCDICISILFCLLELILYGGPNLLYISAHIEIYPMTLI